MSTLLRAVLLVLFATALFSAGEGSSQGQEPKRPKTVAGQPSPKDLVRERGIQRDKDRQERIRFEAAWAELTNRFTVRRTVPTYSGAYQVGSQVVVSTNYTAMEAYRRQLQAMDPRYMTNQQKSDLLLFKTAVIAGLIPPNAGDLARSSRTVEPVVDLERPADTIESRIEGAFEGWNGDTLVELANGQIWKQEDLHLEIRIAFSPKVVVFRDADAWKMHVDGCRNSVKVRRLK